MKKDPKGFYYFPRFRDQRVINGVSTKNFGNMSLKFGDKTEVVKNRVNFLDCLGTKTSFAQPDLIHGTKVDIVDEVGIYAETDALVTNVKGLPLLLLTGDCLPIMFFDPTQEIIGLAHAGYLGSIGKIGNSVIEKMISKFNVRAQDILIGIGPCIQACCYVNRRPVLQEKLPEWQKYLTVISDDEVIVDLVEFNISQFVGLGVKRRNIFIGPCTKDQSDEFFCSQNETAGIDKPGRFASVIMIQ